MIRRVKGLDLVCRAGQFCPVGGGAGANAPSKRSMAMMDVPLNLRNRLTEVISDNTAFD